MADLRATISLRARLSGLAPGAAALTRLLHAPIVTALVLLMPILLLAIWPWRGTDGGPVYSVATVRSRLRQDPTAWRDRLVSVRGVPGVCGAWAGDHTRSCMLWYPALVDVDTARRPAPERAIRVAGRTAITLVPADSLPLVQRAASRLQMVLRHLPMLDRFTPALQPVRWGVPGIYQVRFEPMGCDVGAAPPCFAAVVVNAAPEPGSEADSQ
jgi:hypothetical protein